MLPPHPQEEGTMTLASVNAFFQPKPIDVVLKDVAIARVGTKVGNGVMWTAALPMPAVTPGNLTVENSGLGKHALLQQLGHHNAPTNSD